MTLIVASITPERAVLGVDSMMFLDGEPIAERRKFEILPQIHGVLACRGRVAACEAIAKVLNRGRWQSIEAAAEALPEIAAGAMAGLPADWPDMPVEAFLVGWSAEAGRTAGWLATVTPDGSAGLRALEDGTHCRPVPEGLEDRVWPVADQAAMVRIAEGCRDISRRQVAMGHRALALGGALWAVEVSARGYRIWQVHKFAEDQDQAPARPAEREQAHAR